MKFDKGFPISQIIINPLQRILLELEHKLLENLQTNSTNRIHNKENFTPQELQFNLMKTDPLKELEEVLIIRFLPPTETKNDLRKNNLLKLLSKINIKSSKNLLGENHPKSI